MTHIHIIVEFNIDKQKKVNTYNNQMNQCNEPEACLRLDCIGWNNGGEDA